MSKHLRMQILSPWCVSLIVSGVPERDNDTDIITRNQV